MQCYTSHVAQYRSYQEKYQDHQRKMSELCYRQLCFYYYVYECEQRVFQLQEQRFLSEKLLCFASIASNGATCYTTLG